MTSPFLTRVQSLNSTAPDRFPFNIPSLSKGVDLKFTTPVTFFVGANGSGKSTLLEAIADKCGFNLAGGNRNHVYEQKDATSELSTALRLSWKPKVTDGFFMRAETYFNFASYIDGMGSRDLKGAADRSSIHDQSHGESFISLFTNRFKKGIYILDEPESALSPGSQLAFLKVMNILDRAGQTQFLIATHSPMLVCYPGATLFSVSPEGIQRMPAYRDTEQYRLTKNFLDDPERYLHYLFADNGE